MSDDKIINIAKDKAPSNKAKTGQDAKRWKQLYALLKRGIVKIQGTGGVVMKPNEVDDFVDSLDELIDIEDKVNRREKMQKRREKPKVKASVQSLHPSLDTSKSSNSPTNDTDS